MVLSRYIYIGLIYFLTYQDFSHDVILVNIQRGFIRSIVVLDRVVFSYAY